MKLYIPGAGNAVLSSHCTWKKCTHIPYTVQQSLHKRLFLQLGNRQIRVGFMLRPFYLRKEPPIPIIEDG